MLNVKGTNEKAVYEYANSTNVRDMYLCILLYSASVWAVNKVILQIDLSIFIKNIDFC